jgi:predicted dinucleotide-binding enzyme
MRIGIVGAGMLGSTIARLWANAGYEIQIASRHPEQLEPLAERLGTSASTGTPVQAATFGEVVMVAVPVAAIPGLARDLAAPLAGKVVLDSGNAHESRDGAVARAAIAHSRGSAGWAAAMFPQSRWVKAFNTVYYKVLQSEAHRDGDMVGIPLAGDDRDALETAARLVRDAGFDPVIVGPLARGKAFEPEAWPHNTGMSGRELQRILGRRPEI